MTDPTRPIIDGEAVPVAGIGTGGSFDVADGSNGRSPDGGDVQAIQSAAAGGT